jgi:hypothetical protein
VQVYTLAMAQTADVMRTELAELRAKMHAAMHATGHVPTRGGGAAAPPASCTEAAQIDKLKAEIQRLNETVVGLDRQLAEARCRVHAIAGTLVGFLHSGAVTAALGAHRSQSKSAGRTPHRQVRPVYNVRWRVQCRLRYTDEPNLEDKALWETQLVALQDTRNLVRSEIERLSVELTAKRRAAAYLHHKASGQAQISQLQVRLPLLLHMAGSRSCDTTAAGSHQCQRPRHLAILVSCAFHMCDC